MDAPLCLDLCFILPVKGGDGEDPFLSNKQGVWQYYCSQMGLEWTLKSCSSAAQQVAPPPSLSQSRFALMGAVLLYCIT